MTETESLRSDYEKRCLEALETGLGRTPMYGSWKALDPGPVHPVDARFNALPVLTKDDIRAISPGGSSPGGSISTPPSPGAR